MRDIRLHKGAITTYKIAASELDDLDVLYEFNREGEVEMEEVDEQYQKSIAAIDELELKSTLSEPEDNLNAIIEINSGAGGTESCDWSEMLCRMYTLWSEKAGYKVRELERQPDDMAGIRSATLEIGGDLAYGMLKGENGVHRLVRISPFNAQGKRQTTFASVYVYPLIDDSIEIVINPADLETDTYRASGAGGQHINKTESAVRIKHVPSGIVVACQDERSQHANRATCMQMLRSKLYELEIRKRNEARDKVESGKQKIEWGSQIRSYVLDKQYVTDMRSGHKSFKPFNVLNGDLTPFLKAFLLHNGGEVVVELGDWICCGKFNGNSIEIGCAKFDGN